MNINNIDETAKSIVEFINKNFSGKENILVAIDGCCAAGKTTLASVLQEKTGANLVHMDDFFLRPEQRSKERLSQPGGNVDYERFETEVLKPLREHTDFSYAPFDCHTMQLKERISIFPKKITIIEGSYSCHPALANYYDVKIFLSVDEAKQKSRIEERNGADALNVFLQRWIPMEEKYFEKCAVKEQCDMCFTT